MSSLSCRDEGDLGDHRAGPDDWSWDRLGAVDRDRVVLIGRRLVGNLWSYRTWRAEFSSKAWSAPVEGAFVPLDSKGALVEVRGRPDRPPAVADTEVEWIDKHGRHTTDLRFPGSFVPVFGTRYLMWWRPADEAVVLRSLTGGPDLRFRR